MSKAPRGRARELGLPMPGTPGTHNAITDVLGVQVGFETVIKGGNSGSDAEPHIRTGVTAILPRGRETIPQPVWAGVHALNGNGEMTGTHWIRDGGYFLGPVCLTNTHSVGIVHHAATRWMIEQYGKVWRNKHVWAMPVVAETYDGKLNDINGQHVTEAHAFSAIEQASAGPVVEGNVGGGTGMVCYDFKGGSGTSSRTLSIDGRKFTLAALVQANHGIRPWLTVLGVPVGEYLTADVLPGNGELGSIIVILATDLPALPHQLTRIARRAAIGIGRGGTPGGNNSGDMFLAFSTANAMPMMQLGKANLSLDFVNDEEFDLIYLAVVEAVEEAVLNAMLAAEDTPTYRLCDKVCRALDPDQLLEVMRKYNRLS